MTVSPTNKIREPRSVRGSSPILVRAVKHIVSPIDRLVMKVGRGRIPPPSSLVVPTLLLTVKGRRSGLERTTPLVFVRDGERFLVANARPAGERRNPWVFNLRAAGHGRVSLHGRSFAVSSRELHEPEIDQWWPEMVAVWPSFADHYANTGERTMFSLEPIRQNSDSAASPG